MSRSFADAAPHDISNGLNTTAARRIPKDVWPSARRKLSVLDAATELRDLSMVPAYRLEVLAGDQAGRYSIRVNRQFRITFRFETSDAHEVRGEDYH